jgi:hypothetical protein
MKILVIGGTEGIGKVIADSFNATAVSSRTGHGVPEHTDKLIELSFEYEVVINCIPDDNQLVLLEKMLNVYKLQKKPYFITLGSLGWRLEQDTDTKRKLFNFCETLITSKIKPKHTLINVSWCWNNKGSPPLLKPIVQQEIIDVVAFLLSYAKNDACINLIEIKGSNDFL